MSSAHELWLVRHGETEWSLSGAHTGRTDIALTENGRAQARKIRDYLAGRNFSLVLSSPLKRALETCELAGYGEEAQVDPNLQEWDYGIYEGRKSAEIRRSDPEWAIWTTSVENGENLEDVRRRADAAIARASAAGGNVLLFAHGHLLRILAARWLDLPPDAGRWFALSTAGLSILGWERESRVIQMWNRSLAE